MNGALPRVAVLLSTYNGARFLDEQLVSLRDQRGVEVVLHARDDGSTDATREILARHADRWPALADLPSGPNLGAAHSFLELLRTAPDGADYYAFCDQDDVWLPGKLQRAVNFIAADEGPALYCSNVTCVDEQLQVLGVPAANGDTRFQHLLFENIAYGCTSVMNRAARALITTPPPPGRLTMHDWWSVLVVAAVGGRIHYDPEPAILYRQHGANAVGGEATAAARMWKQFMLIARSPRGGYAIHAQAAELIRLYGEDMPDAARRAADRLVASKRSTLARLTYALGREVTRTRAVDALAARGLVALGWY